MNWKASPMPSGVCSFCLSVSSLSSLSACRRRRRHPAAMVSFPFSLSLPLSISPFLLLLFSCTRSLTHSFSHITLSNHSLVSRPSSISSLSVPCLCASLYLSISLYLFISISLVSSRARFYSPWSKPDHLPSLPLPHLPSYTFIPPNYLLYHIISYHIVPYHSIPYLPYRI